MYWYAMLPEEERATGNAHKKLVKVGYVVPEIPLQTDGLQQGRSQGVLSTP